MNHKLEDLRTIMENGVYKGQTFSEESQKKVRNRIQKQKMFFLPKILTIAVALGFFGLGIFYIFQEIGLTKQEPFQSTEGKNIPISADLNGELSADVPIAINDELLVSLSLPLEIQNVAPSFIEQPQISGRTTTDGYSVFLTYSGDDYEIEMIENVDLPENINQHKQTRTKIGPDEEPIRINGYDAYYSDKQKKIQVYAIEKIFTLHGLHGVEKDHLLTLALMIDLNKPVQKIKLIEK
ncbi:hypothetical protein MHH33_12820 [Paenisporosarcina sp. FSL H8-0542]|uniref:hypothetical protein n=1 Tax=Paenisporosarcina sp. FSL H8-0542 TaxID=2921401 RepID=UPI00315AEC70